MQYPNWAAGQRITAARLAAMLPTVAVKTALQPVANSTVLVDDDHLALPVEAGATYLLDGVVFYDGEYSAGDLKADWAVPAGTAMRWAICGPARGGAAPYASNSTIARVPQVARTNGIRGVSAQTTQRPPG
ncbi:hypothetical protein ACFVZ3_21945, partial [Kitasatospora purpeofusca]|uniref:hypothetical protein n=1 Tax=Kitasatospora purpeofusca TaxID=67352 RepID=UPI00367E9FFD